MVHPPLRTNQYVGGYSRRYASRWAGKRRPLASHSSSRAAAAASPSCGAVRDVSMTSSRKPDAIRTCATISRLCGPASLSRRASRDLLTPIFRASSRWLSPRLLRAVRKARPTSATTGLASRSESSSSMPRPCLTVDEPSMPAVAPVDGGAIVWTLVHNCCAQLPRDRQTRDRCLGGHRRSYALPRSRGRC